MVVWGNSREGLLAFRIHDIQRQFLGIEEPEYAFREIQEDLVKVLGGVNLVRQSLDLFSMHDPLLRLLEVLRKNGGVHVRSPPL